MKDATPSPSPIIGDRYHTPAVSELPFDSHGDDLSEPGCRELLEMHEVWRRVERGTIASGTLRRASLAVTRIQPQALEARNSIDHSDISPL